MSVSGTPHGPHDRSVRRVIAVDHRTDRRAGDQRHVDERHKCRDDSRPIDDAQAREKRRQLTLLIVGVLDEPRNEIALGKCVDYGLCIVPDDHDDVLDRRVLERAHDARDEGVAIRQGERSFRASHAARLPCGEDDGRNHPGDRIESEAMGEIDLHIRCQRCGTDMELRDPVSVEHWKPDQFWVCPKCGRHFWSTYPPPNRDKVKPTAGTA